MWVLLLDIGPLIVVVVVVVVVVVGDYSPDGGDEEMKWRSVRPGLSPSWSHSRHTGDEMKLIISG